MSAQRCPGAVGVLGEFEEPFGVVHGDGDCDGGGGEQAGEQREPPHYEPWCGCVECEDAGRDIAGVCGEDDGRRGGPGAGGGVGEGVRDGAAVAGVCGVFVGPPLTGQLQRRG